MYVDTGGGGGGGRDFGPHFFRLICKRTVPCQTVRGYIRAFGSKRQVAETWINPQLRVSSIFLALDHSFALFDKRPILFETMAFEAGKGFATSRSRTWGECLKQHRRAVKYLGYKRRDVVKRTKVTPKLNMRRKRGRTT